MVQESAGDLLSSRLRFYSSMSLVAQKMPNLVYSVITGGFVHNLRKRGDVDIVTVVSHIDGSTKLSAIEFAKRHIELQQQNDFTPDSVFPTDVVTRQQIVDAISGRSFSVTVDGRLHLEHFTDDDIKNNPEADYRVWLFEMISHDFDILHGSSNLLVSDTETALHTVFLFVCEACVYKQKVRLEKLQRDMFRVAELPYTLKERQYRHLVRMIKRESLGQVKDGYLWLNQGEVIRQLSALKSVVQSGVMTNATHIMPWSDLRRSVAINVIIKP